MAPYELEAGPKCEKGLIVVPEDRQSAGSRNIGLHFYRFTARQPSGRAPVFMLPGGPGGYFDDGWVDGLNSKPQDGSNLQAWLYSEDRDVVLMNQRGARRPDQRYQFFGFFTLPGRLDRPFSGDEFSAKFQKVFGGAVDHWKRQGMAVSGYDIMNMVEDIEDLRNALGYEKIALRGSSFGSQWSFSYIQAHPDRVDRALLSGTEPIDYGYDSPQGIWNVFKRLEERLTASHKDGKGLTPEVSLTEAIQQISARLRKSPIKVEAEHPNSGKQCEISLGVEDFYRLLRSGIDARRESTASLENFPKFIYEVFNEDYRYFASHVIGERVRPSGGLLQSLLIDNSLGISSVRDARLDAEEPRKWLGELNLHYKATRDLNPTPVVSDSFRQQETALPILLVHGDLDLSTPIENAEEVLPNLKNAHLIRIIGGTHSAFDQIGRHNPEFQNIIKKFFDADFAVGSANVASLGFPNELELPALEFLPLGDEG